MTGYKIARLNKVETYYQQLKPIVLAHVKHYQTDFTEHDRKCLYRYTGPFLLGMRESGTNIFKLDNTHKLIDHCSFFEGTQGPSLQSTVQGFVIDANDRFILGQWGHIQCINKSTAQKIFNAWVSRQKRK